MTTRQILRPLTPFLVTVLWCQPTWAGTGSSLKGAMNIVFLMALIVALITFLTQIVLSLVEISSPSPLIATAKLAASISNVVFGIGFTLYLILAREGLETLDSFVVTAFFGIGLSLVGIFGLVRGRARG